MSYRLYVSLAYIFLCSGCAIANYQNVLEKYDTDFSYERKNVSIQFRSEPEQPNMADNQPLFIRILYPSATSYQEYERLGTAVKEYSLLQEILGEVGNTTIATGHPEEGLFVQVSTRQLSGSILHETFCALSIMYVLPCYTDSHGIVAQFKVSRDGRLKRTYWYVIQTSKVIWLGLIPFSWINYLVPTYEDAFRAVTKRFVQNAMEEGFL